MCAISRVNDSHRLRLRRIDTTGNAGTHERVPAVQPICEPSQERSVSKGDPRPDPRNRVDIVA